MQPVAVHADNLLMTGRGRRELADMIAARPSAGLL